MGNAEHRNSEKCSILGYELQHNIQNLLLLLLGIRFRTAGACGIYHVRERAIE